DVGELAGGGLGLGQIGRDVALVEEHLALKVTRLDEVAVDEAQVADAGADEDVGQHGAQRAAAAQGDVGVAQALLPFFADAVKAHLPAVAFQGWICRHASSPAPSVPGSAWDRTAREAPPRAKQVRGGGASKTVRSQAEPG